MNKSGINVQFGGAVFGRFKDLNYQLCYAVSEFVDNSSHSYFENKKEIEASRANSSHPQSGEKFEVNLTFKNGEILRVVDNAYGMDEEDLKDLVSVARPKEEAEVQRSEFGMGLKTGGFWLGKKIQITTKKFNNPTTYTLNMDLDKLVVDDFSCDLKKSNEHDLEHSFTIIEITDFHRKVSSYAVRKTKAILESMYALDISGEKMVLTWNTETVEAYKRSVAVIDGAEKRWDVNIDVNGKSVVGYFAALAKGDSGRLNAGFAISRNGRNINHRFSWWKPEGIFGGEGTGSNTLINQRIFGELEFDKKFGVSQTKDKILFEGDEEDILMDKLHEMAIELNNWANNTKYYSPGKGSGRGVNSETEEDIRNEFSSTDFDSIINSTDIDNDDEVQEEVREVIAEATLGEPTYKIVIGSSAQASVWLKEDEEHDKYLYLENSDLYDLKIIINTLHPAYERMLSLGQELVKKEYIKDCVYDALSESLLLRNQDSGNKINPDSFRNKKDQFLRLSSSDI